MAQSHLSCASGKEGLLCGGSINKGESLLESAGFSFSCLTGSYFLVVTLTQNSAC
jgi:hypothetical protein